MILRLLAKHYLEFLSLTEGCTGSSESTPAKYHIVGSYVDRQNLMLFCSVPKVMQNSHCNPIRVQVYLSQAFQTDHMETRF